MQSTRRVARWFGLAVFGGIGLLAMLACDPLPDECDEIEDNSCEGNVMHTCTRDGAEARLKEHRLDCGPSFTCAVRTTQFGPSPFCAEKDVPTCSLNATECRPRGMSKCVAITGNKETWSEPRCPCGSGNALDGCFL